MPVVEYALLRVDPARADDFRRAFDAARGDLDGATGASGARLRRDVADDRAWLLEVTWERLEQHTVTFPASDGGRRFAAAVGAFFVEPPVVVHVAA